MDKSTIKRLAVQTGFSLKEDTPHSPDLKPYVYEFAQAVAKVAVAEDRERHPMLMPLVILSEAMDRAGVTDRQRVDLVGQFSMAWNNALATRHVTAAASDVQREEPALTEAQRRAVSLFTCWWSMVQAHQELAGDPVDPEAVVLHFMGSGASCMVHAKDLTELCNLLDKGST